MNDPTLALLILLLLVLCRMWRMSVHHRAEVKILRDKIELLEMIAPHTLGEAFKNKERRSRRGNLTEGDGVTLRNGAEDDAPATDDDTLR